MSSDEAAPGPAGSLSVDPNVIAERVGDSFVLVHLETNRIFELNATAARIFELLRAGHGRQEIEARLLDEFDVAPEVAVTAFDRLVETLRGGGLLR